MLLVMGAEAGEAGGDNPSRNGNDLDSLQVLRIKDVSERRRLPIV